MQVTTNQSPKNSCPGLTMQSQTWTGSNIVSIGVQTDGNQSYFQIVQLFVDNNGQGAYAQVWNGFFTNINWWSYVVLANESAAAAESRATPGEAVTVSPVTK